MTDANAVGVAIWRQKVATKYLIHRYRGRISKSWAGAESTKG